MLSVLDFPRCDMLTRLSLSRQTIMIFSVLIGISYYMKRMKWSVIKSRKLVYRPKDQ